MNKKLTFEMDLGASWPPSSTNYDKPAGAKVHTRTYLMIPRDTRCYAKTMPRPPAVAYPFTGAPATRLGRAPSSKHRAMNKNCRGRAGL